MIGYQSPEVSGPLPRVPRGPAERGRELAPGATLPPRPTQSPPTPPVSGGTPKPAPPPVIVQGVIVRPGDTLILSVEDLPTDAEMAEMRQELAQHMPDLAGVVFLENVTRVDVYRPDPEPKPPADTSWLETGSG